MIYATCTGTFIHMRTVGNQIHGRILLGDGAPVQFIAKRGIVKRTLEAIPIGIPISISGKLNTTIRENAEKLLYVMTEMEISSIQTTLSIDKDAP
jgi:hypothetical protein